MEGNNGQPLSIHGPAGRKNLSHLLPLDLFLVLLSKLKGPESPGNAVYRSQTLETPNKMEKLESGPGGVNKEYLAHVGTDDIF